MTSNDRSQLPTGQTLLCIQGCNIFYPSQPRDHLVGLVCNFPVTLTVPGVMAGVCDILGFCSLRYGILSPLMAVCVLFTPFPYRAQIQVMSTFSAHF